MKKDFEERKENEVMGQGSGEGRMWNVLHTINLGNVYHNFLDKVIIVAWGDIIVVRQIFFR